MDEPLFLGFDLSTQQIKIVASRLDLSFHSKYSVEFDSFQSYNLKKGVQSNESTGEVVTPVAVFLDALEYLLDEMKADNFPFNSVCGVNGSCQQHGTVYYTDEIQPLLNCMSVDKWSSHLSNAFSFKMASNWQDRSSGRELEAFNQVFNSPANLCQITGSMAHYRFSGLQIRRRAIEHSEEWLKTYHITLISSFLNTILTGELSGIEMSEACGMNLFDIQQGDWNDELLSLAAGSNSKIDGVSHEAQLKGSQRMKSMLGDVSKGSQSKLIAPYLVKKYGFNSECKVWPLTGDNMATIMSLPLKKDDLLVSMGTSTTVLLITDKYLPSINYHMFKHPVCPDLYMAMLCYSNGALAREHVRNAVNEKYHQNNWDKFNEILNKVETSNVGVYFPIGEIIPSINPIECRFKYDQGAISKITTEVDEDVTMIIESQAISCRTRISPLITTNGEPIEAISDILKSNNITIDNVQYPVAELTSRPNKVFYVGGTSRNEAIVNKFNKILGPVKGGFRVEISDACALGGCYRSIWGYDNTTPSIGFEHWLDLNFDFKSNVEPLKEVSSEDWNSYNEKVAVLNLVETELCATSKL